MFDAEADALAVVGDLWAKWEAFGAVLRVKWAIVSYIQGAIPHEIGVKNPGSFDAPKLK